MTELTPNLERARLAFLTKHEASAISHSGRNLLTHLQGTQRILQRWQLPESVCLAGLFHSVYGTDGFHRTPVSRNQRQDVRNLIGHQAEQLAFLFCSIRRITLFDGNGRAGVHFRKGHPTYEISQDEFVALLHLEYANTLEQCDEIGFLGQFVKHKLAEKWQELKPLLSPACNRELAQAFAHTNKAPWRFALFEPVFWLMRRLNA